MLNAGMTGGIACGKSTVAGMLVAKGAIVIDADQLAHEVEAPDRPVWQAIVADFGSSILRSDRQIDRRKLGAIVFADPEARERLNRLVHPAVQEERIMRIEAIRERQPDAIVISDVPLLFENGMKDQFDLVLLVHIPAQAQIERLMARDGFSREEAEKRLASQWPIDAKLPLADLVIRNDGSREETQRQVDAAWEALLKRERQKRGVAL